MAVNNSIKEDLIQEQILKAAHSLFEKHGFQKVTMDDVAKAIGKGRSSLYYYYKNKDEVFEAVMDAEVKDIISEISKAVDAVATAEEKIRVFCSTKIKIAKKKKNFFRSMEAGMNADELSQYEQRKLSVHKFIMKEESSLLQNIVSSGIKRGELPSISKKELESVVFVLLHSLHGLKREMILENDFSRMDGSIDTLTRMVIQGIKK